MKTWQFRICWENAGNNTENPKTRNAFLLANYARAESKAKSNEDGNNIIFIIVNNNN